MHCREGDCRETEPSEAQSNADCGASGRRRACIAEQKAKPAGKKGLGCEGRPVGQLVEKLDFRPTSERAWAAFSEQVPGRAVKAAGGWVGRSDSAMHQLCDHGRVPAPDFGLLRFQ